jgi:hypothetical protein
MWKFVVYFETKHFKKVFTSHGATCVGLSFVEFLTI